MASPGPISRAVVGPVPWGRDAANLLRSGATLNTKRALLLLLVLRLTRRLLRRRVRLRLLLRSDLSDTRKILGFDLRGRAVLAPDGVVDFLAVHADLFGGVDPQTHL